MHRISRTKATTLFYLKCTMSQSKPSSEETKFSEHCSCGALREMSDTAIGSEKYTLARLTEVSVVLYTVAEKHDTSNDVDDG